MNSAYVLAIDQGTTLTRATGRAELARAARLTGWRDAVRRTGGRLGVASPR